MCRSTFSHRNMGRTAVSSHMNGAKHIKNYQHHTQKSSQGVLTGFVKTSTNTCAAVAVPVESDQGSLVSVIEKDVECHAVEADGSISICPLWYGIGTVRPTLLVHIISIQHLWARHCRWHTGNVPSSYRRTKNRKAYSSHNGWTSSELEISRFSWYLPTWWL